MLPPNSLSDIYSTPVGRPPLQGGAIQPLLSPPTGPNSDPAQWDAYGRSDPINPITHSVPIADVLTVVLVAAFALLVGPFRFTTEFGDGDLYYVLLGLLDGQVTHRQIADPLHYGPGFGYGYITSIYWLVHLGLPGTRNGLITLINEIGYIASVVSVALMAVSLRLMYGNKVALLGTLIFAFSPNFLYLASSGHQLLLALAFFFAANILFVVNVQARWRFATYGAAGLLLFVGLTMRAELPLAFTWLVLARSRRATDGSSDLIRDVLLRSVVCLAAFLVFLWGRHSLVPPDNGGAQRNLQAFISTFWSPTNIVKSSITLVLGFGLAATAAFIAALAVEVASAARSRERLRPTLLRRTDLLAPLSIIVSGTVFWLPDSGPSRHFTLVFLGLATFLAVVFVRSLRLSSFRVIAVGLGIAIGSQGLSEVVRPIVLKEMHSPFTHFPEHQRTTTHVPTGLFFRHIAAISERQQRFTELARSISVICDRHLILIAHQAPLFASVLFETSANASGEPATVGGYPAIEVKRGDQLWIFLDPDPIWPADPIAVIAAETGRRDYHIFQDPYSVSSYDKTPIPAERVAGSMPSGACPGQPVH